MSVLEVEAQSESGIHPAAVVESDETYHKRSLGFWFWTSVVWLALLILVAVLADYLPLKDPNIRHNGVKVKPST